MRTRSLILATLAATMLLAIGITSASAGHLRVGERNFEAIWSDVLGSPKTSFEFIAAGNTVQCRITLLGTFVERTIKKETLANQILINHGAIETCIGGSATIRSETFPWVGRYRSFTGTLPRIRSVSIGVIGATFRIREPNGLACEAASDASNPLVMIAGNSLAAPETGFELTGEPENVTIEGRIPLGGEGFLCSLAGDGEAGGIGLIRNLPRSAKLKITLI